MVGGRQEIPPKPSAEPQNQPLAPNPLQPHSRQRWGWGRKRVLEGGGKERQCLSRAFLFLSSQHCYGDFKQDGGTVPTTHHSRSSGGGGGHTGDRCIAPLRRNSPPPSSAASPHPPPPPSPPQAQIPFPTRHPHAPHPRAPTGSGRGMQRRPGWGAGGGEWWSWWCVWGGSQPPFSTPQRPPPELPGQRWYPASPPCTRSILPPRHAFFGGLGADPNKVGGEVSFSSGLPPHTPPLYTHTYAW